MEAIAEKIKEMQPAFARCQGCDCVEALSHLAILLQAKLILASAMYPDEMKMVEDTIKTCDELTG